MIELWYCFNDNNTNRSHYHLEVVVFMAFISIFALWVGCSLSYLSSPKQKLIKSKLKNHVAWGGFFCSLIISIIGFGQIYSYLISSLITLVLVMCMWTTLVLVSSHLTERLILVFSLGITVFFLIALTGANDVA